MFDNGTSPTIDADFTPRLSVNIWPEEPGIVTDIAQAADLPLRPMQTTLDRGRTAAGAGLGHQDDAAITKLLAARAGLRRTEDA
jgi:3-hydroxyisobutyrate dehydrogenase/2-hydroxy-3-oxopropionate reductase